MTHTLYCHHCNGPLSATDEYIAQYGGQATVCPHCRQPFPIPAAAAAEVAQAGAAPQGPAVLPYATARVAGAQQNVIGFDGVGLVMAKGLVAPDRCVKCNAPGDGRRVVKMMYWHHPALFILILVPGILIYAIVALCVRKSGRVSVSLCATHRAVRRRNLAIAWGVALLGIGLLIGGPVLASNLRGHDYDWVGVAGVLGGVILLLTGGILGATIVPVLTPRKIDEYWVYLKGAGRPFLESLPRI